MLDDKTSIPTGFSIDEEINKGTFGFRAWLKLLGLEGDQVRLISYDRPKKQRSKQVSAWKKSLKLRSSTRFDRLVPPNGRRDWACPWLGILPVWPDGNSEMAGSAAFRFMMVMMGIVTYRPGRG